MRQLLLALTVTAMLIAAPVSAADRPRELSNKELKALLAKASTPQEHRRLAEHYRAKAARYELDAAEHAEMAKAFRAHPTASELKRPGAADTAAHCETLAENLRAASKTALAVAASHDLMAQK